MTGSALQCLDVALPFFFFTKRGGSLRGEIVPAPGRTGGLADDGKRFQAVDVLCGVR